MKPIKVVIPSGGYSSRLAPHFKPLIRLGGKTLVRRITETCLESGLKVILVVGFRGEEVAREVEDLPLDVVKNQDFDKGMFSSIRCGFERAGDGNPIMILPVDYPLITYRILRTLMEVKWKSPEKIVIPMFEGRKGHPVILPRWILPLVRRLSPSTPGLRTLWPLVTDYIEEVPVEDRGVIFNLNLKSDLAYLSEWAKQNEV